MNVTYGLIMYVSKLIIDGVFFLDLWLTRMIRHRFISQYVQAYLLDWEPAGHGSAFYNLCNLRHVAEPRREPHG